MDLSKLSQQPTYLYLNVPPTANGLILQEAVFKLETPTTTTLHRDD